MDIKTILGAGYNLGENIYKRGRGERAQVGGGESPVSKARLIPVKGEKGGKIE